MEGGARIVSLLCLMHVMDNWLSKSTSCSFCSCNEGGVDKDTTTASSGLLIKTSASRTSLASQLLSIRSFAQQNGPPGGQIINNLIALKKGGLILIIIFKMGLTFLYSFMLFSPLYAPLHLSPVFQLSGELSPIFLCPAALLSFPGCWGNHKGRGFH